MIDLETLLTLVSEALNMRPEDIRSKSMRNDLNDARSLFIHFAKLEKQGRQEIIDAINMTSKSVVNYHVKRVADLVITDKAMRASYVKCSAQIKYYRGNKNRRKDSGVVAVFVR